MPEISVIMSVYNLEDETVLGQSVHSILRQTFRDFEFIICDDGSTDGTWELLEKFAKQDERIVLIRSRTNRKAGHARNCCIKRAKGKYVAVTDADDICGPERLERLYQFLEANPQYGFAGSRGEYFVRNIGDDGESSWYLEKPGPKDFLFSLPFVHASVMFRKDILQKAGGYSEEKNCYRTEDYDLLLRLYGVGIRGYNLNEILYYIRRDENQYKRRKYRYRFNEARIRFLGFRKLGLMPKGIFYAAKPLIVGLIPIPFMKIIQKKYYGKKQGRT